ncbi:sensor domain-containing protein [Halomonas daqiaonensis]|uniref:cyclic-guanylate-specific phosphodiesterase n=1 Tax=Halomonas daqiaonensis TaxID=650850 RepID=A0A1H7QVY5_9GAMM|nr:EAL domain-containing protein [Halomonas daqiaonensis]SEL52073.1 PAS domain S-box-containing protein/diguanylate cyclase (GGDEF) domain-containing protein [Halomonas daqiaonensis]
MKISELLLEQDPFFTLSLDLFAWVDRAGNFMQVNPAFKRFLGYELEELKGKSYAYLVVAEDCPLVEEALARLDQERPVRELVVRVEDSWGHLHWIEVNAALCAEALIHMVARDITHNRRLSQEVDRLAERLITTLDSITDGFFTLDTQWRFSYLNATAERLLEHDLKELEGVSLWDAFPECLGTPLERKYRRAFDDNVSVSFETRYPDKGLWFEVNAYPSREGLAVYFRDISSRKSTEKQLNILERSIAASTNGVIIADAGEEDQPIIYANPAFERLTGYRREEILGRNCRFLQGPDTDPKAVAEVRACIRDCRETRVVLRNYRKDGTSFWNELNISPVPDEEGQVTHFIGVQHDITTQRDNEERLAFSVTHDLLTGLPNRNLLEEHLKEEALDTPDDCLLGVLFVDLDGFKPINDTLGHQIGDMLLEQVAVRLSRQAGPGNSVARFEADEFVVVMGACTGEAAVQAMAEEILAAIARPYRIRGNELRITASIGVAVKEGLLDSPMILVQRADMAMYRAKRQGHNTIYWYRHELAIKASESVSLRRDIQQAIDNGQFELHYQPQLHGPSGRVTGFEALIRWQHPERGFVSPVDFIGLAESTGQIIPISDWVLETAFRDARELNALGMSDFTMAVNISPMQFQRTHFVSDLLRMLEKSGLAPELLELELTEGVLMENAAWAVETLGVLRREGLQLAIDDFGTGFSSLSYLKHLPVSKVKIDRTFINDLVSDHRDAAIVKGIIAMARAMKLQVLAEGVETHAQYAYLSRHQCTLYQGFHFARPMPLARLKVFLDEHHRAQKATVAQAGGNT